MPFFDGYELLGFALDAEREDKLFLQWVVMYQTQMDFKEFKMALSGGVRQTKDNRTAADVLKMVKGIIG